MIAFPGMNSWAKFEMSLRDNRNGWFLGGLGALGALAFFFGCFPWSLATGYWLLLPSPALPSCPVLLDLVHERDVHVLDGDVGGVGLAEA
jgi:hypothetical protein